MKFIDIIKTLILVPNAYKHIYFVKFKLKHKSFENIIIQPYLTKQNNTQINILVKSYFWAARLLKDGDCLPRSIALYQKLKALGYPVKHKFGVNNSSNKLTAHAWVEYNNTPLNENKNLKNTFSKLDNPK